MKVKHPNGQYDYVMVDGTMLIGEIDLSFNEHHSWINIGFVGDESVIQICVDEWPAFMALVKEIDEAMK